MGARLAAFEGSVNWARVRAAAVWGVWGVAVTTIVGSALLWVLDGLRPLPLSFATGAIGVLSLSICGLVFASLGAILATKLARNPIGWLFLAVGIGLALLTPVDLLVQRAFDVARPFPQATRVAAWLMSSLLTPVATTFIVLVCLVFPDGRFLGGRWWIAGVVAVGGGVGLALASAIEPTGLIWYPAVPNPAALGLEYLPLVDGMRLAALLATIVGTAAAAGSIAVRYRRSDAVVRRQLRWIVSGVAAMVLGLLPFLIARYALETPDAVGEVLVGVAAMAVCTFPLAVALAIVRQHLFDIDTIISKALVYVPLMGLLAGLYTASVTLFQRIFVALTNDTSDLAVVLSALILASVFAPIRSGLEGRVRSSFRPESDADARLARARVVGEPMPAGVAPAGIKRAAATPVATRPRDAGAPAGPQPAAVDADLAARISTLEAALAELRGIGESREDA